MQGPWICPGERISVTLDCSELADAEVQLLDAGSFALETHAGEITALSRRSAKICKRAA
jgi:hypothetical protein